MNSPVVDFLAYVIAKAAFFPPEAIPSPFGDCFVGKIALLAMTDLESRLFSPRHPKIRDQIGNRRIGRQQLPADG